MLWRTIDYLESDKLSLRVKELANVLDALKDADLIEFQNEYVRAFRLMFKKPIYELYCSAFEGEVNQMGLVDFSNNIMLTGQAFYRKVMENPDCFAEVPDVRPFNNDYVALNGPGLDALARRYGRDEVERMLGRQDIQSVELWETFASEVEEPTWRSDWNDIRLKMPRVYVRWGKK